MADKKMDKTTLGIIAVIVIIIAVAIYIWLSEKKKDEDTILPIVPSNGGAPPPVVPVTPPVTPPAGEVDLIGSGVNYIEVFPWTETMVQIKFYPQPTGGLSGSNILIDKFEYWMDSWLGQGLINQTQHDNALEQFEDLVL